MWKDHQICAKCISRPIIYGLVSLQWWALCKWRGDSNISKNRHCLGKVNLYGPDRYQKEQDCLVFGWCLAAQGQHYQITNKYRHVSLYQYVQPRRHRGTYSSMICFYFSFFLLLSPQTNATGIFSFASITTISVTICLLAFSALQ